MNIKYSLTTGASAIVLALALGLSGCGGGDGDSSNGDGTTLVPADGITGIWTGTFSWVTTGSTKNYDVTMMFHTPDGAERGTTGGAAWGAGPEDPDEPHFLFEGGYEYFVDPIESDPLKDNSTIACEGDVWAVGRFGAQGSFVQEFSYATGSAAGPDQRGAGCLYLDGNKLTGSIKFEEGGSYNVDLTYSAENARDTSVNNLNEVGTDTETYHLWSNDNSGISMAYTPGAITPDSLTVTVIESRGDLINCGGTVMITKVPNLNMYTLATTSDVSGCTVNTDPGFYDVDLPYSGLGALVDLEGDGNLSFVHLMASSGGGAGATAQALYNEFSY